LSQKGFKTWLCTTADQFLIIKFFCRLLQKREKGKPSKIGSGGEVNPLDNCIKDNEIHLT
jgi:hypothetical protein